MTAYAAVLPPERPLPVGPISSAALPAKLIENGFGGALVTIGATSCPYANARMAREHLEAMERQGHVRIIREASPC